MQDDKRLAAEIAQGDGAAFAVYVDTFGPRLHRLVRRYTHSEADAEDVTQEVFLALYRGMASFRGDATLATWTYRIALNHCLGYAGRPAPPTVPYDDAREQPEPDARGPSAQAARRELGEQVHSALACLSPDHREVVILHELQDLTYAECAVLLQVPVGTVKSRLSYAFRRLRGTLSGYVLSDALPEAAP